MLVVSGLSACVVAAFNYHQGKGGTPILELLKAAQTELSIPPNDVSSSDMAELEAFANLVPPPTSSYVSPLASSTHHHRLHARGQPSSGARKAHAVKATRTTRTTRRSTRRTSSARHA